MIKFSEGWDPARICNGAVYYEYKPRELKEVNGFFYIAGRGEMVAYNWKEKFDDDPNDPYGSEASNWYWTGLHPACGRPATNPNNGWPY